MISWLAKNSNWVKLRVGQRSPMTLIATWETVSACRVGMITAFSGLTKSFQSTKGWNTRQRKNKRFPTIENKQASRLLLLYKLSYSQFCVKIPKFLLPQQQLLKTAEKKIQGHRPTIKLADPVNPRIRARVSDITDIYAKL